LFSANDRVSQFFIGKEKLENKKKTGNGKRK
jgi:hypothetical protein